MKKHTLICIALLPLTIIFTSCTRNGTATEQSPNMGAQGAEGGTTPHVSDMQDSTARNRSEGAEENSGVSSPVKPGSTPTSSAQ